MADHEPFEALLDEARADEAVRARLRERWLRHQAEEGARFAGLLLDLAEQGAAVGVRTAAGRVHQGTITGVAADFVAVRAATGIVLVAFDALALVRPQPGGGALPASGDRPSPVDLRLVEALAALADDRPRVAVATRGNPDLVAGTLRAVGADVLTIASGGDPRSLCYVALAAVAEVTLLAG